MAGCALGLGALVLALPVAGIALKIGGVAYLFWLAAKIARSSRMGEADAARLNVTFAQGAALQFVNIKAWMLALAIASGWIAGHVNAGERLAQVLPLMMAYAFASNVTYALAGSLLRNWLAGPAGSGRRLLVFNRAMALVLVVTALWMLTL